MGEDRLPYHIIAFAAPAGGLNAPTQVLSALPAAFPTPILKAHAGEFMLLFNGRNDELRHRSDDLNSANSFLASVLSGIRDGLIVVDRTGRITGWNPAAEELWGLRADEVQNKSFFSLDIGLPVNQLGPAVRAALTGETRGATVKAVNRRGKHITCTVEVGPLRASGRDEVEGAVLLMQAQEA